MPRTRTSAQSGLRVQVRCNEQYVRIAHENYCVVVPLDLALETADLIVDVIESRSQS